MTQPRLNDLLRGQTGKFSLDVPILLAERAGLTARVQIERGAAQDGGAVAAFPDWLFQPGASSLLFAFLGARALPCRAKRLGLVHRAAVVLATEFLRCHVGRVARPIYPAQRPVRRKPVPWAER